MNRAKHRHEARKTMRLLKLASMLPRHFLGAPIAIGYIPDARADNPASYLGPIADWTNAAMGEHAAADLVCFAYAVPTLDPDVPLHGLALELLPRAHTIAALIARGHQRQADELVALGGILTIPLVVCESDATTLGVIDVHPLARGGVA